MKESEHKIYMYDSKGDIHLLTQAKTDFIQNQT